MQNVFLPGLLKQKMVMVTGKGGTGKTLLAATIGLLAANEGKKVLLVETSAWDRIAPLFGKASIGHSISRLLDNKQLFGMNIDPKRCFEDYVVSHLQMPALYDKVFRNSVVKSFIDTMPGLSQVMLLGRLFHASELDEKNKFDMIVFDAPATGHFLSLMTTPKAILSSKIGGPLSSEVERVLKFLNDHEKTSIVVGCLPQSLVVSETIEGIEKLKKDTSMNIKGLLLNRWPFDVKIENDSALTLTKQYVNFTIKEAQKAYDELMSYDLLNKWDQQGMIVKIPNVESVDGKKDALDVLAAMSKGLT